MPLSWKQQLARVLGAWTLGFSGGLSTLMPFSQEDIIITLARSSVTGLITALPRITRMLDDYGKQRVS